MSEFHFANSQAISQCHGHSPDSVLCGYGSRVSEKREGWAMPQSRRVETVIRSE
ncbi:hypothetical protein BT69DRAFT_1276273 [Atractiella rhizophila]|nr:hypothetical protein BT69DRAFT_1276273 [Atractiella rhizophila]